MSGDLFFNDLKVYAIGVAVKVPDNDIARLMYYLSFVDTVINHNQNAEEEDNLTKYSTLLFIIRI